MCKQRNWDFVCCNRTDRVYFGARWIKLTRNWVSWAIFDYRRINRISDCICYLIENRKTSYPNNIIHDMFINFIYCMIMLDIQLYLFLHRSFYNRVFSIRIYASWNKLCYKIKRKYKINNSNRHNFYDISSNRPNSVLFFRVQRILI